MDSRTEGEVVGAPAGRSLRREGIYVAKAKKLKNINK